MTQEPEGKWTGRGIWQCKIGVDRLINLPLGSDFPMRCAIRRAYKEITGIDAEFVFSGWNETLTDGERRVVENK